MSMFKRKDPSKLQQQLEKFQAKGFQEQEDAVWKLDVDKQGNGQAVIRFLPGRTEEDNPFVKLINHGFQMNGKWYINNCTSTHGDFESCPVCTHLKDNDLYNTDKDRYQLMKRKTSYWANILIIKDPANPANEGKVFKYRFGVKIFDKILLQAKGNEELGEPAVDVTCPFEGADFILKVKKVDKHLNYDDSKFKAPSEIANITDEAVATAIMEQMHPISDKVAKTEFKEAAVLKAEFDKVVGATRQARAVDDFDAEMEKFNSKPESKPETTQSVSPADSADVDDDLKDLLGEL